MGLETHATAETRGVGFSVARLSRAVGLGLSEGMGTGGVEPMGLETHATGLAAPPPLVPAAHRLSRLAAAERQRL